MILVSVSEGYFTYFLKKIEMNVNGKGVPAETFYGPKTGAQVRIEAILNKSSEFRPQKSVPDFMTHLLGPSRTWKVFRKQQEAIDFCLQRRNGLMSFAFEQVGGSRLFLVAHPKIFWALNSHRFFKNCSTYEIIQEYGVCKLYLDIEYEYKYNSGDHDGDRMLNNFLHITNSNLCEQYGISCSMENILVLDSSSEEKYSHHVIYQIPNIAFQNNYAVGNFVQMVCNELTRAYDSNSAGCKTELDGVSNKYKLKPDDILELFVTDNKGKTKLFVDQGVYTKNRHFRLLGSTKMNKKSPLIISQNNKYKPQANDDPDLGVFLDSLITYFSNEVVKTLECDFCEKNRNKSYQVSKRNSQESKGTECLVYPEIDKFIQGIISPFGAIRRKLFFSSNSKIIYDICGYRYCDNIKRHHKSNNIMFIIDLKDLTYYQKCHDPDCAGFRSEITQLPEEVRFGLEDDTQFLSILNNDESDLAKDEDLEIPETEFDEILRTLLESEFE